MSGWGSSSATNCSTIHGYPQAVRFFESRGPVRSHRWKAEERPLLGTRHTWYRMRHLSEEDAYELILYDTPMVRYEAPDAVTGEYTVLLRGHQTRESWLFLAHQGWHTWRGAVGGYDIPLSENVKEPHGLVPAKWSAKLVFDKDHVLIREKSDHREVYVQRSTDADKAARRKLKDQLNNVVDLLMLRIPSFHAESTVCKGGIAAFKNIESGSRFNSRYRYNAERAELSAQLNAESIGDGFIDSLLPFCQKAYNHVLCAYIHELDEDDGMQWGDESGARFPQVPDEKFRKVLMDALMRRSKVSGKSGKLVLPKFVDHLPTLYFAVY